MNITMNRGTGYASVCLGRWELLVSTRAWADDVLERGPGTAVAFDRTGAKEVCLRLPLVAFWVNSH